MTQDWCTYDGSATIHVEKNTGKSWTSVLFKTRFDQDLFWFWKKFISITAKLWKIFEPNLVSWLFTSQGIGLMKKCTQNWLKMSLMIRVNGYITLSCTWKYSLNERKLKQNTHLKQDLCSGFSRFCLFSYYTLRITSLFHKNTLCSRSWPHTF